MVHDEVIFAVVLAFASAITDEDCVRLSKENPLKTHKYYQSHENDCNKYYQCSYYGLVEFNCPEGLYFDAKYHVCGRPREVNC